MQRCGLHTIIPTSTLFAVPPAPNKGIFRIPFIYAYFGKRGQSDKIIRNIVSRTFTAGDNDFPVDEHNGSMSAWYIFTSIGIYPLIPRKAEYVVPPLATNVKLLGKELPLAKERNTVAFAKLIKDK